jgi:hypothetical protein
LDAEFARKHGGAPAKILWPFEAVGQGRHRTEHEYWEAKKKTRTEFVAGPVGFEPTAPGLPRAIAGLEGRCFGHPDFRCTGAVQAELRARYAHTGLLPISAFFYAAS